MSDTTIEASHAATAAATSAASGMDPKAKALSIQTPVSASYPSELRSPHPGNHAFLKREETIKTPITPPSAYMDFLKTMSPSMMTPPMTSGSNRFPSHAHAISGAASEESAERQHYTGFHSEPSSRPQSKSPPTAAQQQILSRQTSTDSTTTTTSASTTTSTLSTASSASTESLTSTTRLRPESPRIIIPPSPFVKPGPTSARTPRRLNMPPSPFSAGSSASARSVQSPYSTSALSQTPWSASFSPRGPYPSASSLSALAGPSKASNTPKGIGSNTRSSAADTQKNALALNPKTTNTNEMKKPPRSGPEDRPNNPTLTSAAMTRDSTSSQATQSTGKVLVREVVTQTYTFSHSSTSSNNTSTSSSNSSSSSSSHVPAALRAPIMDPAPKGKRRRCVEGDKAEHQHHQHHYQQERDLGQRQQSASQYQAQSREQIRRDRDSGLGCRSGSGSGSESTSASRRVLPWSPKRSCCVGIEKEDGRCDDGHGGCDSTVRDDTEGLIGKMHEDGGRNSSLEPVVLKRESGEGDVSGISLDGDMDVDTEKDVGEIGMEADARGEREDERAEQERAQ